MSNKKLMKKVLVFSLSATMVFAIGSSVYASTQALPNGTIVNQNGANYLTDSKGEKYSGWFKDSKEDWYYFNESDKSMKTGWHHDDKDGYWYYLNLSDGKMATDWQTIDGKEYFFQPVRDMGNYNFNNEHEKWFYSINSKIPYGAMYINTTLPDGSKVDSTGAKINISEKNTNSDFKEFIGEYTLKDNINVLSGSSLWLTISKLENDKIWANVQAGAGSGSGEAYGEVAGAEINNGKFTILLDNILPPMGTEKVEPYTIEFSFTKNHTINTTVSNCIYDTLAIYTGTLHCISNSSDVNGSVEKSKMNYSLYIGKYSDLKDYQNEYWDVSTGLVQYISINDISNGKVYGKSEYGYMELSMENFESGVNINDNSFSTVGTREYWEKGNSSPYETVTYAASYTFSEQDNKPVIIRNDGTVFYLING